MHKYNPVYPYSGQNSSFPMFNSRLISETSKPDLYKYDFLGVYNMYSRDNKGGSCDN